jgi:DNA-binding MarR family transcriptional regulator
MSEGRHETDYHPTARSFSDTLFAPDSLTSFVRRILKFRRRREALLGASLFADPAWDMLLDLLIAEEERRLIPVTALCHAAPVPTTTALRYVGALKDAGFIVREPHPDDRRIAFVRLTSDASSRLRTLLAEP